MTTPRDAGGPEPPPVGWPEDGPAYRPMNPEPRPVSQPPRPAPYAAPPGPPSYAAASTPPRPTPRPEPPAATTTAVPRGTPVRKGPRKARLTVTRIDPWSTLKFSFVYSLAGLVVLLVAVIALYAIVDAMGVIGSIRSFLNDVEGSKSGGTIADWLGFGRVMTVALVIGCVNVILFTAFATLTAFVYNVCTDLVGGIEVTLADRN